MKDNGEQPPILRIKKGAERDIIFHGAQREPKGPRFEPRLERGGFLRRNRTAAVVLVNFGLVIVLIFLYRSRQTSGLIELDGYRLMPSVSVADNKVSLRVVAQRIPSKAAPSGEERLFVKGTLVGSGNELLMSEVLSKDSVMVQGGTAYGGERSMEIQLTIGHETATRRLPLSQPVTPKR